MLAEATALLLASLTVVSVAGAPVVPANSRPTLAAVAGVESSGAGASILTETEPRGAALLDRLVGSDGPRTTGTTNTSLNSAVHGPLDQAARHDALRSMLADPPVPRTVTNWWGSLESSEQWSASRTAPELVGNLDGVPYAVRDQANRAVLRDTIDELELALAEGSSRSVQTRDDGQLQMLYSIADALGPADANPHRQLITLDVEGAGKASIVLGDLMTADYVSYLVPGMFISVGGNMVEWVDTAARIYDEQVSWLALLDESTPNGQHDVATVAWIGYQTPHLLNVGSLDLAYEGRDALASTLLGLDALRGADQPHVSLLSHSYGTTAAMLALSETPARVDALAMIGSPGSPAASIDDLKVSGAVFVGEAAWDPISNSAFFGSDPGETAFGARAMSVAGSVDLITQKVLAGSTGHNEYFSPGTESMRNLALVGIGQADLVTDGTERDALRTLAFARPGA